MIVLNVRNAHEALPAGLRLLRKHGYSRDSRNGAVLMAACPVTTVYKQPEERVMLWPERDANPFFHLYEALWMLAGRNDVAPLVRYVKRSDAYSDNGVTLHGAYGHRWRKHFDYDQLAVIAGRLMSDENDRRCVLQMWDAKVDGGGVGKDYPCNTIATFQRGRYGELNLSVFCRSNDIVWGAYGANAVQFSMLLEYMALWIGCEMGTYSQISVNYHAYLSSSEKVWPLADQEDFNNPYDLVINSYRMGPSVGAVDAFITFILHEADSGFTAPITLSNFALWQKDIYLVLLAHHIFKTRDDEQKYTDAMLVLEGARQDSDWVVAASEWLHRRLVSYRAKREQDGFTA